MKKLTAILLTLALALSLTACKGKDDPVKGQEPEIPGTINPPPSADEIYTPPDYSIDSDASADPAPDVTPADPEPAEDQAEEPKPSAGITASHSDVSLFSEGEAFTMSAKGIDGIYASSFTSKNPEIATVDEMTGVITAVSPGMTTITMHVECDEGQYDFDCIVRCRWEAGEAELPGEDTAEDPGTATNPGTEAQPSAPEVSSSESLSGFFSTLQGKYEGLGMMMAFDSELLENYYPGLSSIAAVEEVLIQETAISTANIAVGLVRLSDDADLTDILQVQSVFQNRISTQANGGAFYPDSCETWENGVITSVGNCVGMFVYPEDANGMASLFTSTFGS